MSSRYVLHCATLLFALALSGTLAGPVCILSQPGYICLEGTGPFSSSAVEKVCQDAKDHNFPSQMKFDHATMLDHRVRGTCDRLGFVCPKPLPNERRNSGMKEFGKPPCYLEDTMAARGYRQMEHPVMNPSLTAPVAMALAPRMAPHRLGTIGKTPERLAAMARAVATPVKSTVTKDSFATQSEVMV